MQIQGKLAFSVINLRDGFALVLWFFHRQRWLGIIVGVHECMSVSPTNRAVQ